MKNWGLFIGGVVTGVYKYEAKSGNYKIVAIIELK